MTVSYAVTLAALSFAFVLAALRWIRVAQREHYLPGEVSRFSYRWWGCSILNRSLVVLLVGCGVACFFQPLASFGIAIVAGMGPIGLGIKGRTSSLSWTRRLRMLASFVLVIVVIVVAVVSCTTDLKDLVIASGLLVLFTPCILDGALWCTAPVERHFAQRFVHQASLRLARVNPTIIAITGSYGKTTTKGFVAHLLSPRHVVVASPRSFNNRAGLARTVNDYVVPGTEVLIAEMGAYGPGEIAELCSWLPPEIAVITAIGPVHLERFKDLSVTLAAKAEIADRAKTVVLNVDDERLRTLVEPLRNRGKRVITCSATDTNADVCVRNEVDGFAIFSAGKGLGRSRFDEEQRPSAVTNVACAVGVGVALGDDLDALIQLLDSLPRADNRLVPTMGATGIVILDDTFNANPAGASLALDMLARSGSESARRVVVTPGMIELGPVQFHENCVFSEHASRFCNDVVIVGRTNRRALLAGAKGNANVVMAKTREEAVSWVRSNLVVGDAVLYENDLPDHYP